jgi:hypothetical protein
MTYPEQVTETKFLQFVVQPRIEGNRTVVIHVRNKRQNILLGEIRWYGPWRQYCFMPQDDSLILNHTCLHEIAEICRVRTMGQREASRLRRERGAQL